MKDPAVLFYTADFLIGVSDLTDEECGKYIKLLCLQHQKGHLSEKQICLFFSLTYEEHMKNICSTYEKDMKNTCKRPQRTKVLHNYFSAELLSKFQIDENGNLFNERFELEAAKRAKFAESRRNNRRKKEEEKTSEKDTRNICSTYVQHMENENENINENINENVIINNHLIIDPYNSKEKNIFEKIYEKVFGKKPFLTNENCLNFSELASKHKDFFETLEENLIKVSKLDFKQIGYKPGADWFLNPKNYVALRNGAYDEQIKEREYINDGFSY